MSSVIGQIMDGVEFEEHTHNGRTGMRANVKVGGRYAFPDKRGAQPKHGDVWKVEIVGENPNGSVYFLRCLELVSSIESRQADRVRAQELAREKSIIRAKVVELAKAAMTKFDGWDHSSPTLSVEGYGDLPITIKFATYKVTEAGVEHNYTAQVSWDGSVLVGVEGNRIVLTPWSDVEVVNMQQGVMSIRGDEAICYIKTPLLTHYTDFYPLRVNPEWGTFVGWKYLPNKVVGIVRVSLPNGVSAEVEVPVGEFVHGEIKWSYRYSLPETLINRVPEVGLEQEAYLQVAKDAYEQAGEENKSLGLLLITYGNIYNALVKAGIAGVGWAHFVADPKNPHLVCNYPAVIHPDLLPLFEGATGYGGKDLFVPLVMHAQAPVDAWQRIEWPNGRIPDVGQITSLRADIVEVCTLDARDDLQSWLSTQETLAATIVAVETPDATTKYRFDAVVQYPHHVTVKLANGLGTPNGIILSQGIELRPYTIAGIATGNEYFEGEATLTVEAIWHKRGSYTEYKPTWKAPKTQGEITSAKVAAILELIALCRNYGAILTGWRFTDSNLPVIYVGNGNGGWVPYEFNTETYDYSRRKGSCSTKGDLLAYGGPPSSSQIAHGLKTYASYGWPVAVDSDPTKRQNIGKSILDLFPAALIEKLEKEGGV